MAAALAFEDEVRRTGGPSGGTLMGKAGDRATAQPGCRNRTLISRTRSQADHGRGHERVTRGCSYVWAAL